jgi:hypothetical protein
VNAFALKITIMMVKIYASKRKAMFMKIIKLSTLIILAMVIILGISRCVKPSPKEAMMKYMQNKYHEQFEFVSVNTQVWSADYFEMKLRSKKFPDDRITVQMVKDSGVISDNYAGFLMKKPIEDEFNHILAQVYKDYRVFYLPGNETIPGKDLSNLSILEYSRAKINPMTIVICLSDKNITDEKDKQIEELRVLLKKKQYQCDLYVFYMLEGKLAELNDSNINEIFTDATDTKWAKVRGGFLMNDHFQFELGEWMELK